MPTALARPRNARKYFPGGGTAPLPPASATLLTGLLASYRLNHAGATWIDSSGAGLDLTMTAATGYAVAAISGRVANAAEFSQVGQTALQHAYDAAYQFTTGADKTLALWFKPYSFANANQYLATLWHNTTTESSYQLSVTTAKKLQLRIRPSGGGAVTNIVFSAAPDLALNNWYLVFVRWDHTGQLMKIRLINTNGTAYDSSTSYTAGFTVGTLPKFALGASVTTSTTAFDGAIDDVNIWSRLLTDAECVTFSNNRVGLEYPFDGTVENVGTPPPDGTNFYASPTGSSNGSGDITQPWDIATALSGGPTGLVVNAAIAALPDGQNVSIHIRGGTGRGRFPLTNLEGTALKKIYIINETNEVLVIDTYGFGGNYSTLDAGTVSGVGYVDIVARKWGQIILQNTSADRYSEGGGNNPSDNANRLDNKGVYARGDGQIRLFNVIVRDCADSYWFNQSAIDTLMYGCIAVNSGWNGPNVAGERGHGHGVYGQNDGPEYKTFEKLVSIGHYATGGKAFTEGGRSDFFKWYQCVFGNNGQWYAAYHTVDLGEAQLLCQQYFADQNSIYVKGIHAIAAAFKPLATGLLDMGGNTGPNNDYQVVGNYLMGSQEAMILRALAGVLDIRHNTVWAQAGPTSRPTSTDYTVSLTQLAAYALTSWLLDRNDYFAQGRSSAYLKYIKSGVTQSAATIAAWKAIFSGLGFPLLEANSTLTLAAPTFKRTFCLPVNHADHPTPGQAILISYNFPLDNTVTFVLKHTITTSALASTGARTISVNALTGSVNAQENLTFGAVTVKLERPAVIGDTVLYIEAASGGISSGATATFDVGLTNGQTWEILDCFHLWDTAIDPLDAARFVYSNEFVPVATGTYLTASPTITLDVRTIANGGPMANNQTNPGGMYFKADAVTALTVPNPCQKTGIFLLRPT